MDPSAGDKLEWCENDEGHISIILTFNSPLLALHTLTERPKLLIMFTEQQKHTHFSSSRVVSSQYNRPDSSSIFGDIYS